MSALGISPESIKQARIDSNQFRHLKVADSEYNVTQNDGMTLKLTQDNTYDWMINRLDRRRLVLEKKTEILHDYYSDRLLARDLFKDYNGFKSYSSTLANGLTVGVLAANLYTRVMKNSILLGKIGTIGSIIGIQALSRYVTNNYLENKIKTPWQIHTRRMQSGLGPTNTLDNEHDEITNSPLRFMKVQVNPDDMLYGTKRNYVPSDVDNKAPLDKELYPYAPDSEDYHKIGGDYDVTPRRIEMQEPQPGTYDAKGGYEDFFSGITHLNTGQFMYYNTYHELFKDTMNGVLTIYRPDHETKYDVFQAARPDQVKGDKIILNNEYDINPLTANDYSDMPEYATMLSEQVNLTEDNLALFSKIF